MMTMMRAAALLLLLASPCSALRGNIKNNHENDRKLKKGDGVQGPCGAKVSAQVLAEWNISESMCNQANEQRDDACETSPVNFGGDCQTTEQCSAGNPLESCVIIRSPEVGGATTVCGILDDVAAELGIQPYACSKVCAGNIDGGRKA